jgi:hypothetical protein
MKKTTFLNKFFWLLLILSASAVVFNSCEGDDDGTGTTQNTEIVGTWEYSRAFITIGGQTVEVTDPEHVEEITFGADGTYSGTEEGVGTYRINGLNLSVTATKDNVTQTYEAGKTFIQEGAQVLLKSFTCNVTDGGDTLIMSMETAITSQGITIVSTSTAEYVRK